MPESQMLINYVPGEECRVAIVEDGRLEELYVEKFAHASRVGNIYVGKVANVEPAIQAAFVDFGVGENGFLHISDLHPRYFPGEDAETTERVGLKTPRRERPLIQQALRRGDEVIVQVLKEGVGTKGPTLTSYLSIPGRFLVMMPYMDKVGVSRKVEDEDARREMRQILDQLELPEGFGFILRTAGMDRTKTDLKRDLAYLQRLWKDMERRKKVGGKPRLLYSESDLLVRSLRDMLTTEINEVVIDNELAVQRASRFMKIVAPRSTTKLLHYPGKSPIFHAFNVEREVSLIHAREVPLPSGGRLVIDQTEALVAIDVNSGKSRESRDAETNAYQTNIEAVDEICRQLRLRDMGGIVVNDLIDMRRIEHRRDIENRFKERLKRDRAKSTVTQISEFGIIEMTRQRMRPSHESTHFTDCPTCRGRGLVQKPESVASDALRDLAAVLDVKKIAKVELAVSPRVAGELLSHKRQLLGRLERHFGKHVDVRVSETLPVDRVSFFAYDELGADVDLSNLAQPKKPSDLVEIEAPRARKDSEDDWSSSPDDEHRRIQDAEREAEESEGAGEVETHPIEIDDDDDVIDDEWPEMDGGSNVNNRRRGTGRGRESAHGDDRNNQRGNDRLRRSDGERRGGPGRSSQDSRRDDRRPHSGQSHSHDRNGPRVESERNNESSLNEGDARRGRRRRGRRGGRDRHDDRVDRGERSARTGDRGERSGEFRAPAADDRYEGASPSNISDGRREERNDRPSRDDRDNRNLRTPPRESQQRFRPLGAVRPEDDDDEQRLNSQSESREDRRDDQSTERSYDDTDDNNITNANDSESSRDKRNEGPYTDDQSNSAERGDGGRRRRRRRRGRRGGRDTDRDSDQNDVSSQETHRVEGTVSAERTREAAESSSNSESSVNDDSSEQGDKHNITSPRSESDSQGESSPQRDREDRPRRGRRGRGRSRDERVSSSDRNTSSDTQSDVRSSVSENVVNEDRRILERNDSRPARDESRQDTPDENSDNRRESRRDNSRDDRGPRREGRGGRDGRNRGSDRPRNRDDRGNRSEQSRDDRPARKESPNVPGNSNATSGVQPSAASPPPAPTKPPVRTLYGSGRRKLSPSELNKRPKPE